MVNPTRDSTAGRVYNDLRNAARRAGRSTDEVMIEYILERFLYRLATSPAGGSNFVLKGGLLLAQFGARRATRDIDILGQAFSGDDTEIIRRITEIAGTEVDDGVLFDAASLKTVPIREDGRYHGLRLVMPASIAAPVSSCSSTSASAIPSPQNPSSSSTSSYWLQRASAFSAIPSQP
ncbi:nucleotidyl transferase AbiEii/AbiGii toxin family protein [Kribbella sp. NPDC051718]|uniref:nucleotidyl transferase AbiEii/AbiGii toxin family protein n=1 Tax=Kribbella sp. NPDC051718 TaxID=3155168 RepID=UPI0034304E9D